MPDLKITGLTADTTPTSDDLIVTVNDPAGTPANRKVTLANAITKAHGLSDGLIRVDSGVMTIATGEEYKCENYGAAVAETAANNTTAIQAALNAANSAGGGTVTLTDSGTYNINGSLIIYSNTRFLLSSGVTIKRAASTNLCMIKNSAFVTHIAAGRTTITIAWTAGAVATVTWAGHALTSEDYVWIEGASSPIYNNVFRVADVVDANTFIILLTRVPTASPTGTITALKCNINIEIEGGNWDGNQLNNASATGYDRDNWIMIGLGHSRFSRYRHRGFHRGITCGALSDCQFSFGEAVCSDADIAAALNSECHKLFGPMNGVRVTDMEFRAADDASSLQVKEAPAFSWTGIPFGDIHDASYENIRAFSRGLSAAAGLVVYASDSETYSKIRYKNIFSHSEQGSGLIIKYGDTFTTGTVDDVEIDGCVLSTDTAATQYAFSVSVPYRQITIKKFKLNQASGTQGTIRNISTGTGGILCLDELTFNDTAFPSSAGNMITLSGVLDKFILRNSRITANQTNATLITLTAAVDSIELTNNYISNVSKVINENSGTLANLLLSGNVFDSMAIVYEPRSASIVTNVTCLSNYFTTVTTGCIRPSTGTGLVARIYGSGNSFSSATFIAATGSATWGAYSTDISVDPTTVTGIDTTTGQYLTSTQAGTSAGLATRTSTGWVSIGTRGDVSKVGTPVDNQVGVWTGDGTIEGDTALTFNTATDKLSAGGTTGSVDTGTIELGHATDTTLSRVSAGVIAVEGVTVLTTATGQPLDADLTTIAGLTATSDNIIQSASSAWASRTPAQVTATLPAVVGDSGAGGTKGLVPAPGAGDAAAGKFLKADGAWVTPAGSGDVSKVGTPVNNQVGVWTGDGTIEGDTALTFDTTTDTLASGIVTVTDDAYGAGWNGSTAVPTKNAIYDKIETLGGGGTVTATGGALTANSVVLGAGTTDTKVVAGITTDGISQLNLGVNTTTLGKVKMFGSTSGDATIQPAAVAGTATVLTLPATTDTLVGKATTDTLTNKTLTSPTFVTPVLGTPSSGTLTNCTGLPVNGIVDDTTSALGVGTIELGHATDTTLSRTGTGALAVEGVVVPTISSTNTLTNKRITPRVSSETSSATPTINTDTVDAHSITALAEAITSFTTNLSGTPTNFQKLTIRVKDNATPRTIAWGSSFEAKGVALPTTTVASKVLTVGFIYDTVTSKWGCVASAQEA